MKTISILVSFMLTMFLGSANVIASGSAGAKVYAKPHVHSASCKHAKKRKPVKKHIHVKKHKHVKVKKHKHVKVHKHVKMKKHVHVNKRPTTPVNNNIKNTNQNVNNVKNTNQNVNNVRVSATGGNASATGGYAAQKQGQQQSQSLNNSGNSSATGVNGDVIAEGAIAINDNSTTTYKAARIPVNTAYAAPLVASNDTCMGSTSGGGQGITFGLSFATTWTDKDCVIRKDARFLHNTHRVDIALALMCEKESVRRAVSRTGTDAERKACGLDEQEPVQEEEEEYGENG